MNSSPIDTSPASHPPRGFNLPSCVQSCIACIFSLHWIFMRFGKIHLKFLWGTVRWPASAGQQTTLHCCQKWLAAKLATATVCPNVQEEENMHREGERCKKEGLVETMFRLRQCFPSSLLTPPLLLMSGLRRQQQQQRNRVRSVASAQAAGSNERLLARDFQRAQLAPASRWDSFFPRPTLHNSRP